MSRIVLFAIASTILVVVATDTAKQTSAWSDETILDYKRGNAIRGLSQEHRIPHFFLSAPLFRPSFVPLISISKPTNQPSLVPYAEYNTTIMPLLRDALRSRKSDLEPVAILMALKRPMPKEDIPNNQKLKPQLYHVFFLSKQGIAGFEVDKKLIQGYHEVTVGVTTEGKGWTQADPTLYLLGGKYEGQMREILDLLAKKNQTELSTFFQKKVF